MENPAEYYQDDVREELINGVVVAMAPGPTTGHSRISGNIALILGNYLKGKRCEVFIDGVDVHLTEKDCFQPDCPQALPAGTAAISGRSMSGAE